MNKKTFKFFLNLIKTNIKYQISLFTLGLFEIFFTLIIPIMLKVLFDNIGEFELKKIILYLIYILIASTLSILIEIISGYISNISESLAGAQLKEKILIKSLNLPFSYFDKNGRGKILSIAISDTEKVGRSISAFYAILLEILNFIIGIIIIWSFNYIFGIMALLSTLLYYFSMSGYIKKLQDSSRSEREDYSKTIEIFRDTLDGSQEINIYNSKKFFISKVKNFIQQWISKVKPLAKYQTLNYGIQQYLSTLLPLLFLGLGLVLIKKNLTSIGVVIAVFSYLGTLYNNIERISYIWNSTLKTIPIAEKIIDFFNLTETKMNYDSSISFKKINKVEFKNINFYYKKDHPILENINLIIQENQKIAIVGQSGSGKSTLANILLKFIYPQNGEIYINNTNITNICVKEFERKVLYTGSNPHIFQGTVYENITMGIKTEKERITDILNICGLNLSLDSFIGEGFGDLSLGQKQRIGLARIFLRNPDIIILDEATSGIDSIYEKNIMNKLLSLNSIIIILSHRISTIKYCEKIFVLNDKKITASGSHEYLMKNSKDYINIFKNQI
ncbi:ABC-type multidrug transport system fused ATPase/permease subunit [Oceanotoga teriensis]|uniref:ABC-type multidrug transport system fused ATPase/permease subunit n=1 Tax=Oceanotoga teriensis TaxID=515440 RepID=A0AA45HJ57_9BACT|nr:ABC transporter ATP-binding protein [Oceanotoga teriensis]PWJ95679.1 ABC-type multidrug transport system fused ATPase/permease subunit [Oceanotoga teriensis]